MNSEKRFKAFTESITTNGLGIFTSLSTVAFGVDRWANHSLWIGGSIFVFMGLVASGIIITRVILAIRDSDRK